MDFQDKVVVITGGGGGIGKAAARRFLAEGARVVLNSRRQAVLDQAARELDPRGQRVALFAGDASVPETARVMELSERTVKREWRYARAWLFHAMS